jgi:hypothetical protein
MIAVPATGNALCRPKRLISWPLSIRQRSRDDRLVECGQEDDEQQCAEDHPDARRGSRGRSRRRY